MLNHLVWSHPVLVQYSSGPVPGNNQTDIVLFLSIFLFCYQLLSRFTSPVLCTPRQLYSGSIAAVTCIWLLETITYICFQILRIARAAVSWPLNASMYLQRASWFRVIRLGWPILPRLWMPWDAEQFEFKPAGRAPLWSWRPSTPTARWSFTRPPWKSVEKMKRRTFHDFMTPFHDSWCNLMQSDAKMICESLLELFAFYRRAVTLPRQKPWGISRISVAGYLSDVSEKTRAGAFEGHRRRLRKPSTK